ncbi:SH3 domain-containing protein [Butyrivibrio sp. MC2013]|uniref:SH3 domain-containing protein n=1 Tax=Butyrivibrio sp. MC2013 TaxID=1280686 RepID=UPI0003FA54EB|nr:SH3 domain-containing protein [Butyrivibrio sp. MC2013]
MKKKSFGRIKRVIALLAAAMILSLGLLSTVALADTYGTTSNSVRARAEASTQSEAVGSFSSGQQIQVLSQTTGADGYTWYEVNVQGGTGWIRGDLISVDGKVPTKKAPSTTDNNTTDNNTTDTNNADAAASATDNTADASAQTTGETEVTAMDPQSATVSTKNANVRSGAGTGYSVAGTVVQGDALTITGTSKDADGKEWYYVSMADGTTGFIRSDLVTVNGPVENADAGEGENTEGEGENAEGEGSAENQESSQSSNGIVATNSSDSYFVYVDGNGVYQLVDNSGEQAVQYEVNGVLLANQYVQEHGTGSGSLFNGLSIVLLILVVVLTIIAVILFLRLREMLYYDVEGYDEGAYPEDGADYPEEDYDHEPQPIAEEKPQRDKQVHPDAGSAPRSRRARNFADDDDMEFEFLDLDKDEDRRR